MSELKSDLPNRIYHKNDGYFSSSRIKMILSSPKEYWNKYVMFSPVEGENQNFIVGNAIHSKILEPDKFPEEFTSFKGRKSGKAWEEFKENNPGKTILGDLALTQIEAMYQGYLKSKVATELMEGGESEVSLYTELFLTKIKVRADRLCVNKKAIIDIKSTTGAIDEKDFRRKLESASYGYDLSAALYVDAFNLHFNTGFDFYWVVLSKDTGECKVFKASEALIKQGREKYRKALTLIKEYEQKGWKFEDSITTVEPLWGFSGGFES